ncbi:SMC family ATPase [Cryobacterium frigoriphilum]|uniref:Nuclease SbcCD subunit C n=1 Tax=Cryobacterium frigoriphilum TaxID=1259150 RepID=A0A4R9A9R4_9MICO|nr:AAA family ATPase [Cryobacterium frigoriphilum]TFD54711.1 SMC family ATPase [Cryobacterium frigoriphilum]
MKILRLRLAGFGPYKNEQLIDFEKFDDDGIFLITGKTGAGKSSILDAICFALYAQVPRFDGGELSLRSDHCAPDDPTFVELVFSVGGQQYRVYRTPRYPRPKKRGGGTTISQPDAVLEVRQGDDFIGVAARPVDVGNELSRILPLKVDQFLQVILLAQNRFQKFLLAKTEDRRTVLRTLFGTARFEQLESALIVRRKLVDGQLADVVRSIEERAASAAIQLRLDAAPPTPDLDWFDAALTALRSELAAAAEQSDRAALALLTAVAGQKQVDDVARRQQRRDAASARLGALDEARAAIDAQRLVLQRAARAARVWPQVRAAEQSAIDLAAALTAEADARARWCDLALTDADANADTDANADAVTVTVVRGLLDALLGRLGTLDDALGDERRLPALDSEITDLAARVHSAATELADAQSRIDALPEQITLAETDLADMTLLAAREGDATADRDRAEASLAAATVVAECTDQLRVAQQGETAASAANTASAARYEALLAARFAGFSSELASRLVPGQPCSVCGAAEHPHPSNGVPDPVTEIDLDAARLAMTARQHDLADAHDTVQTIGTRLATARARAGDRSVTQLTVEVQTTTDAQSTARAAAARTGSLADSVKGLRSELAVAAAGLVDTRASRDAAASAHTERLSHRQTIAARVAVHRGDFASIGDQVAHLEHQRDLSRRLVDALEQARERADADTTVRGALAAQLLEEHFDRADEVGTARLTAAEITRRQALVRVHDDALAAAQATLAEPDLIGLPLEPVNREPADLLLREASVARDDALTGHSSVAERAGQLSTVVTDVRRHFTASAALLVEQKQVRGLADVVHGDEPNTKRMRLESFVLAAQLEEIVAAANQRLRTMTSGRYTLEHDDAAEFRGAQSGLGLAIRDEHTGRARATQSLSGGETFLASLALALGLAEVVTNQAGGITLDTLFVDEGFGSLDSETLETAMGTLDTLRAGGRTIGLISHVESMKEQIPARLSIVVTDQGYSEVEAQSSGTQS